MNFNKDQIVISGITGDYWVHYEGQFIGRFKHGSAKASANHFVKFLVKHFTVEEFFAKMKEPNSAPVRILEEKGYVSYNIVKILKKHGYDQTREAFQQFLNDRRSAV